MSVTAPLIADANWAIVGTCGSCGGPVKSPIIWDTTGTYSGSPRPCRCAYCGKETIEHPGFNYGPKLEMKP